MDESIISRVQIQAMGAAAFKARRARDSHGMKWNALSLPDWLKGYDNAERDARLAANQRNEQFVER